MERKRKVDLGDEDPSPAAAAAAGTSGGGSDSARKRQANGGGGGGGEDANGGNAQVAAAANGKHQHSLREFDEKATVSPYTGREYSKKYFEILEKRKGENLSRGERREEEN